MSTKYMYFSSRLVNNYSLSLCSNSLGLSNFKCQNETSTLDTFVDDGKNSLSIFYGHWKEWMSFLLLFTRQMKQFWDDGLRQTRRDYYKNFDTWISVFYYFCSDFCYKSLPCAQFTRHYLRPRVRWDFPRVLKYALNQVSLQSTIISAGCDLFKLAKSEFRIFYIYHKTLILVIFSILFTQFDGSIWTVIMICKNEISLLFSKTQSA